MLPGEFCGMLEVSGYRKREPRTPICGRSKVQWRRIGLTRDLERLDRLCYGKGRDGGGPVATKTEIVGSQI
jgi:hypothetical protein